MFGYGKARLFGDLGAVREVIDSVEATEIENWMQKLPEIAAEKEPADVLAVVFVVERITKGSEEEERGNEANC